MYYLTTSRWVTDIEQGDYPRVLDRPPDVMSDELLISTHETRAEADAALDALRFLGFPEIECPSCLGYGHFREDGTPTIDRRERTCLDCRGSGKAPAADAARGPNTRR